MEITGQYWCPIWNVLEKLELSLSLANPQRIKRIPGRKNDQKDSEWIAQLSRLGLVASSYIPSREIQELRSLTRTRKSYINERMQHRNRVQNVLQHANIKLADFIADIFTGSGLRCLELLINGEKITDQLIRQTISKRCKHSPVDIAEAMNGAISNTQRILLESHLRLIERIDEEIHVLNEAIEEITSEYSEIMEALQTIPGIKKNRGRNHFGRSWTECGPVRRFKKTGKVGRPLSRELRKWKCSKVRSHHVWKQVSKNDFIPMCRNCRAFE